MVYILNMALTRFQENRGNPMVEALCNFITLNLERPLEQVASWGVEVSDKPLRTFYVRFTLCCQKALRLKRRDEGQPFFKRAKEYISSSPVH